MHSTLQEARLIHRSFKSSCRYCSARTQSSRRSFHRTSTLRNTTDPGSNSNSESAPPAGPGKDAADNRTSPTRDGASSVVPQLPVTAPSLGRTGEQNQTNGFYGSSFNRRQRVRAQQEVTEPPFSVPEWFVDSNVALWSDLAARPNEIGTTDDFLEAKTKGEGGPPGGDSEDKPSRPRSDDSRPTLRDFTLLDVSRTDASKEQDNSSENNQENTPRYYLEKAQCEEVLTTLRGSLRTAANTSQNQGEPAVKANNVIIRYAGKDAENLLDELVRSLATSYGSHLVDLDVQDISDLISQARTRGEYSIAEARMLSYDALVPSPRSNDSGQTEPSEDMNDEFAPGSDAPDMDISEMGFPSSSSKSPSIMKAFTIDLTNLGDFGSRLTRLDGRHSRRGNNLLGAGGRSHSFGQSYSRAASPAGPFSGLCESLLSTIAAKKARATTPDQATEDRRNALTDKLGLPRNSTLVHVKDINNIEDIAIGHTFMNDLCLAVEAKRQQGEHMIIVGTECPKHHLEDAQGREARHFEALQQTPMPSETDVARIIVVTPPRSVWKSNNAKMSALSRSRRIASINLRHIWQMMRVWETGPNIVIEPFSSHLKPGFWKEPFLQNLTIKDRYNISQEVWSFQYVHRLVSYMRGLGDGREAPMEMGLFQPVISYAIDKLAESDLSKLRSGSSSQSQVEKALRALRGGARGDIKGDDAKLSRVRAQANKHETRLLSGVIESDKMSTTFDDVHAPAETIEALQTLTTLSLINPEAFTYGVLASDRIPGLLLYGPPGTGKTLLAKAVAKESGATMLEVSAADLNDMYVGEGEKNVKALFSLAKKLSPCVVFLDEADAMFSARSANGRRVSHRELLNQFLKEWDGMSNDAGSAFLMVATNRPMDFDDAVLRRLPRRLLIDLPTEKDRHAILKIHLKAEQLSEGLDLADLAKRTPFYSGSDLKNLCVAAALTAVKEQHDLSRKAASAETASVPTSKSAAGDETTGDLSTDFADDFPSHPLTAEKLISTLKPSMRKDKVELIARLVKEKGQSSGMSDTTAQDSGEEKPEEQATAQQEAAPSLPADATESPIHHEPAPSSGPKKRVLTRAHFDKALEEITASVSEDMNSLKEIKKFDDVYGDKRSRKKRAPKWGFTDPVVASEVLDTVKVRKEVVRARRNGGGFGGLP
ncbi:Protein MSP1 [Cyphellophora attinorum]|uniref:Protein MSP1 n=1 Tax=Cyphellophora attinorum TaxID=1664694 RepID=A0A0N0NMX4_9EURO|nr:Protein MSP1 [Phialophora attinorum]KPI40961.1 Protein MSP1 [Phialophora attinorum]